MSENKNLLKKFYIPLCRKCNGILNIKINPLNFSIEYECEFNKYHNDIDIFFKTFERFYLKEQKINGCSKCNLNLENSEICFCEKCKCFYCNKCCFEDITKNGHKNITFEKNINRCNKHNYNFNSYCIECKENICLYCINHKNHNIKDFKEIIPSLNDIQILINKIKERFEYYNLLIEKINSWKKEVIRKTEELKQNLRDEISLFEKIIINYN